MYLARAIRFRAGVVVNVASLLSFIYLDPDSLLNSSATMSRAIAVPVSGNCNPLAVSIVDVLRSFNRA